MRLEYVILQFIIQDLIIVLRFETEFSGRSTEPPRQSSPQHIGPFQGHSEDLMEKRARDFKKTTTNRLTQIPHETHRLRQ